ncbi:MAG: hypothetical protein ACL7BU_09180 [Candidatus Phlomobacter fragariae]
MISNLSRRHAPKTSLAPSLTKWQANSSPNPLLALTTTITLRAILVP